jgi:8-oxo-dGTP pyrophosphatase MutT (NUDIX family)
MRPAPVEALLSAVLSAVRARDAATLAALFGADGELSLGGRERGAARGAEAAALLLRAWADPVALGPALPWIEGGLGAAWGWQGDPERIAGEVLLVPAGEGLVGTLTLRVLPGGPEIPRERVSVRAVLLAPGPRVLLFECHEPGQPGSWWITPGGGIEPGEDDRAALQRELAEEVGLDTGECAIGPCVWTRAHAHVWQDRAVCARSRFYLVHVERAREPAPRSPDFGSLGHRWWTLDELASTDAILSPRGLPRLLAALLRDGPPPSPIDAGL